MTIYSTKTEGTSSIKIPSTYLPDWKSFGNLWLFPLSIVVDLPRSIADGMKAWAIVQTESDSPWLDAVEAKVAQSKNSDIDEIKAAILFSTKFKKISANKKDEYIRIYLPSHVVNLGWINKHESLVIVKTSSGICLWDEESFRLFSSI